MVEKTFCAAHFIPGHQGPCKDMHGHNYRVQLFVQGTALTDIGMLVDYGDLKAALMDVLQPFDHQVLNDHVPFSPTAELLSRHVFQVLSTRFAPRARVSRVVVWETDHSFSAYSDS